MDLINSSNARLAKVEEICGRTNPWDRAQKYMQDIGFFPFGEPEEKDPLVVMGQVCVALRQGIDMCPKIKDLEDAKDNLNARINEVESTAAADLNEHALKAQAESEKIREDLETVSKIVQGLVRKNEEDGDLAGGLRQVTHRVDQLEERHVPEIKLRLRKLEDVEPAETNKGETKKKTFLDGLT